MTSADDDFDSSRLTMTRVPMKSPDARDFPRNAANAGSARLGSKADQAGNDHGREKDAHGG
jgi:hypothetical protein